MTQLSSKFDIISHDPHPAALASQMVVLEVKNAPAPAPSGTPTPGTILPGTIVIMDPADGKAIVADNADAKTNAPCMFFVAIDGDVDYDGAFVHKLTAMAGGGELEVENYVAAVYQPGDMLTCGNGADAGKWRAAAAGEQIYGVVGPNGLDSVNNVLDVIVPQGIAPAA
jgi:hypothetical protein